MRLTSTSPVLPEWCKSHKPMTPHPASRKKSEITLAKCFPVSSPAVKAKHCQISFGGLFSAKGFVLTIFQVAPFLVQLAFGVIRRKSSAFRHIDKNQYWWSYLIRVAFSYRVLWTPGCSLRASRTFDAPTRRKSSMRRFHSSWLTAFAVSRRHLNCPVKTLSACRIRVEDELWIGLQQDVEKRRPKRRRIEFGSVFNPVGVAHHTG